MLKQQANKKKHLNKPIPRYDFLALVFPCGIKQIVPLLDNQVLVTAGTG